MVKVFCSSECATGAWIAVDTGDLVGPEPSPSRVHPVLAGGALVGMLFLSDVRATEPPPQPARAVEAPPRFPAVPPPLEPPPVPTIEEEWVAEILRDIWIHPLRGPNRRMPVRDSRVFGAERPGERPAECKNGHCGVDIGGETWGEPVIAVHDGVIDRVVRGPNEERGGLYVRIAHRDGTIFTQYFHLAAIPRWITVGKKVEAGEVIGLVGDSGVKESGPHLHFTISVRPDAQTPEQYIDPEPLIALWPLRMPVEDTQRPVPVVSTTSAPGAVRGAASSRKKGRTPRAAALSTRSQDLGDAGDAPPEAPAPAVP